MCHPPAAVLRRIHAGDRGADVVAQALQATHGPVVQPLRQPTALGFTGIQKSAPGGTQVGDLIPDLRLELHVPRGEASGGCDGIDQPGIVEDRGIVDKHGDHLAVAHDPGHFPAAGRSGHLEGPSGRVDEVVTGPAPEGDLEARVAQDVGEGVAQRAGRDLTKLDGHVGDRRLVHLRAGQPGREQHCRSPERKLVEDECRLCAGTRAEHVAEQDAGGHGHRQGGGQPYGPELRAPVPPARRSVGDGRRARDERGDAEGGRLARQDRCGDHARVHDHDPDSLGCRSQAAPWVPEDGMGQRGPV